MLPHFIVIGAYKAGTTSLHEYFAQHPGVYMTRVKEPNYFAFDPGNERHLGVARHDFPVRSLAQYEALFANAPPAARRGEASPAYLHSPVAPERIRAVVPDVRLIVSLRSPVDRAYSHFQMALRSGRLRDPSVPREPDDAMWFRASLYAQALQRYMDLFGRDRICCVLFDDLVRRPAETMQNLFDFVGADRGFRIEAAYAHNPGGMPRHPRLYRALQRVRRLPGVTRLLPSGVRRTLARARDATLQKSDRLDPSTRRRWSEYYRHDIERTADLLGIDLGHWLESKDRTT